MTELYMFALNNSKNNNNKADIQIYLPSVLVVRSGLQVRYAK